MLGWRERGSGGVGRRLWVSGEACGIGNGLGYYLK